MEEQGLSCPVGPARVDETVVRLIAAQIVLLISVSILTDFYWITAFVLIDFTIRGFFGGQGSVLKLIGKFLVKALNLKSKFTNEGPKRFAARIGFVVVNGILAAQILDQPMLIWFIGVGLIVFAVLESVFAVCVGCILYQWFSKFLIIKNVD